MHERILLSPDDAGSGIASADPAPQPSVTADVAPTAAPTPEQQPQGEFVSSDQLEKFQRYEQQAKGSQEQWRRFNELGYGSIDEAYNKLTSYQKLETDPTFKSVVDAFNQPQAPASEPSPGSPITPDQIDALVDKRFAQQREEMFRKEHTSAAETETRLLGEAVKDSRLAAFFQNSEGQPIGFDDAYAGKGSRAATLVSSLIDTMAFQRAERYENGQPKPITDPAMMEQIRSDVLATINEVKAMTLMEASTSEQQVGAPQMPGTGDGVVNESGEVDFNAAMNAQKKRDQAAAETFRKRYNEMTGGGLPASQQVL